MATLQTLDRDQLIAKAGEVYTDTLRALSDRPEFDKFTLNRRSQRLADHLDTWTRMKLAQETNSNCITINLEVADRSLRQCGVQCEEDKDFAEGTTAPFIDAYQAAATTLIEAINEKRYAGTGSYTAASQSPATNPWTGRTTTGTTATRGPRN